MNYPTQYVGVATSGHRFEEVPSGYLTTIRNIEVIVPPEINVECDGDAFMGTFTMQRSKRGPASVPAPLGAPVVRVIGDAYAAAVNVRIKTLSEKTLRQRAHELLDG